MSKPTIAILGAGNMGASLLGGVIHRGYQPDHLIITDTDTRKLDDLKDSYQVGISIDNSTAVKSTDVVILAVKPQILPAVCRDIAPVLRQQNTLVISIAAGMSVDCLAKELGSNIAIVRAMPNMPALINAGATALYANAYVNPEQKQLAQDILSAVGLAIWIEDEAHMDVVTALSGSGPAYFFYVIDAMQRAAEHLGLPHAIANALALQTAYGASRMALESDVDVTTLRKRVTSPGGTTEKAIQIFDEKKLDQLIFSALQAATQHGKFLATQALEKKE